MRIKTAVVLGGLCAFHGGCSPLASVTHLAGGDTMGYSRRAEGIDPRRAEKLADVALEQVQLASPEVAYSTHYAEGFKKGFADYLLNIGNGETPLVPPTSYHRSDYDSVQGRQAVLDWFRGFREGTTQAQASGLRPTAPLPVTADRETDGPNHRNDVLPLPEMNVSTSQNPTSEHSPL